ncbi:MAG: Cysteine desulfurase [candidate division TA06 bacterium ADurb.Bin131]|jgi:cysteine desulfurase|uniref:Cysteine desulfurase n=1 Tax=candidate division TA06 bacterium ADurb.Bin131 TaxID=1852827 RepID=A0A1V6C5E1_UNCT6|nr:MAG: Cysteine desulfurase [candidate division TA06 bacterium ADurb.Bin131]
MVYLDYNATTPCLPEVVEEMKRWHTELFFNPSSIYSPSQEVKKVVEDARKKIAGFLDALPEEIIFTSGGTESANIALTGSAFAMKDKGNHIITSSIEHHAVLNTCKFLEKQFGFRVTYLPVDRYGIIDPEDVKKALTEKTILISIMAANNEIGTIEPIEEIGKIAKESGITFHCDGVQVAGKIPVSVKKLNVDFFSISAHKFYGPKGIGALYIRKGTRFKPIMHGGHQEKGLRPGTENVPGIIGMAKACEISKNLMAEDASREKILRDELENNLVEKIPEIQINGHPEKRLYNTLNLCVKYVEGESMLLHLDFEGICASSGSACTSGSLEPSHVLLALGIPPEVAHGSLRFSLGRANTMADIEKTCEVLPKIVENLRKMSPFWDKK